jgi:hypothetical protein
MWVFMSFLFFSPLPLRRCGFVGFPDVTDSQAFIKALEAHPHQSYREFLQNVR